VVYCILLISYEKTFIFIITYPIICIFPMWHLTTNNNTRW
jgi:hypothetical protein